MGAFSFYAVLDFKSNPKIPLGKKTDTAFQTIFLPATHERKEIFFEDHELGTMAVLCAVFSYWVCLAVVLSSGKVIMVLQLI
jgi:hypothetical protein